MGQVIQEQGLLLPFHSVIPFNGNPMTLCVSVGAYFGIIIDYNLALSENINPGKSSPQSILASIQNERFGQAEEEYVGGGGGGGGGESMQQVTPMHMFNFNNGPVLKNIIAQMLRSID
ncbi:hypothetical protein ACJX0J_021243 [Zea mays]